MTDPDPDSVSIGLDALAFAVGMLVLGFVALVAGAVLDRSGYAVAGCCFLAAGIVSLWRDLE